MSLAVKKRLSFSQFGRLPQLLLLAVTVLTYNVMAMAIANSLFVSHVGAGQLPIAFILIGLCSLPAYGVFSQVADRYSRPQMFCYVLSVSIAVMLGLRLLVNLDVVWVYYVLLIAIFFQWDFNNNLLYPGLLTDYFTTIEYKQYAPFIGIAQAVGTLIGGGLTILLSHYFPSRELLLVLPIFMAIAFGQLVYLESSQRRLETRQQEAEPNILESLKTLSDVGKRYPLVLFLAISTFLLVIIYISSEFLWFNIYGQRFSESQLTGFLGLMRMIISLIQVVFLYGITRPLLRWVGVARLNAVYPVTTLLSLANLLLNFNLLAAIGLHINGDALYKAINLPIHQLNYNGIPHQYVGRIRALSDGLIYSVGLTTAGIVLWLCHLYLSLEQITWLAIALTVVLLLVRLPMGKFYTQSLESMIRSDTINLDDFSDEKNQLPPQSSKVIKEFLTDGDRFIQIKGLELAANFNNPAQFFPEVKMLFPNAQGEMRREILKLFSDLDDLTLQQFTNLLTDDHPVVRATALEVLLANQYVFEPAQLEVITADSDQEVRTLGLIATFWGKDKNSGDLVELAEQFLQLESTDTMAKAISSVIRYSQHPKFVTLIEYLLPQISPAAQQEALSALVSLAQPQDSNLAKIAVAQINHPVSAVRVAAFKLLKITCCPEMLEKVAMGLSDNSPQVRGLVADTLPAYGQAGLTIAKNNLNSNNPDVVNTAIAAIAQIKSKRANEILFKHLTPEFQLLALTRKWQQQIPRQDPSWRLLSVAIEDFQQRLLQKVLYILSCLGYSRTVSLVRRILATSDRRDLANAVEVLASINHRRFIQPLMPLLEQTVSEKPANKIEYNPQWLRNKGYKLLLEALESGDRWIGIGASVALSVIPATLLKDPDPVVQLVAQEIFPSVGQFVSPASSSMNRLLLLRNIALFKNLSLDELFPIDRALEQRQVMAGETIYTEGSWGWHLYIIAEGRIQIVKDFDGEQHEIKQLTTGQYFGEIALFDEATRWDSAIALEDSVLLCLEKKRFISLISQRPHIILEICRFLSQRLRETDKYMSAEKVRSTSEEEIEKII
ncbi:cyclic nucleotide-binding domain-containing protein [Pleurocapsales cyanobacterium LEGE 10410]|nr:cyclic nucleotide-binding domain-containing protein [Pleurocapsales cyanobacterium LEGE 10410]